MRDWLVDLRKGLGLTLREMGEKIGVSESYYLMIEQGKRQRAMDITLISRIAAVSKKSEAKILKLEKEYLSEKENAPQ